MVYFREEKGPGTRPHFKMNGHFILKEKKAQTAIEYILLLTTVMAIVLIGLRTYLPDANEAADIYYNRVVPGILGAPPRCGDGVCDEFERLDGRTRCPIDCM